MPDPAAETAARAVARRRAARRAAIALVTITASTASAAGNLELAPCELTAAQGRIVVDARCGTLAVPIDARDTTAGTLTLNVAVIPALAEDALPDPLLAIAGGPGQAATEAFVPQQAAFARVHRTRDIVLVDQRGTGSSAPLDCASDAPPLARFHRETVRRQAADCLASLAHDVRFFTTSAAVRDLDAVRQALGYETWNLYGISYGTRVAQHYLRRYPQHTRSVVLDGVVAPAEPLGPAVAIDAQRALDLLFDRCDAEAACRAAYPRLHAEFHDLLRSLERAPARVSVPHPLTGDGQAFTLTREMAVAAVRMLTYSAETAALLPALVHEAALGRPLPLATQAWRVANQFDDQVSYGMNFSVVCSEDYPRWRDVDRNRQRATYLGTLQLDMIDAVCSRWPRGEVDADLFAEQESSVPVLLLSGEADPVTPPANARAAARGLSRARHLVLAGQGHGQLATGCVPRLVSEFIDDADPVGLDARCLDGVRGFPLFTSPLGPAP
jgi:pimeloyl-ACP methyl ester carboxylesterase